MNIKMMKTKRKKKKRFINACSSHKNWNLKNEDVDQRGNTSEI